MLHEGFETFINRVLKNYTEYGSYKVSFVGSVAYAYQDLIKEILTDEGFTPGAFYKNPLNRLIAYHTRVAAVKSR